VSAWLYLLQQAACSWSLLLSLGLSMGLRKIRPLRLTATAVGCGCVSLAALPLGGLLRFSVLLPVAALAPIAAWPGIPRSRRGRMAVCSMALSLLMAGCGRLLHTAGLEGTPLILAQFALLPILVRLMPAGGRTPCVTLEIHHHARNLQLTALVDSGNLLRDPLTRLPVIVISQQAAARLLPAAAPLAPGMRLISVRTVAGSALMPVFRPRQVRLLLPQGWRSIHAVIGLSPDGYSGFQALVPASVITTAEQGGMSICP